MINFFQQAQIQHFKVVSQTKSKSFPLNMFLHVCPFTFMKGLVLLHFFLAWLHS